MPIRDPLEVGGIRDPLEEDDFSRREQALIEQATFPIRKLQEAEAWGAVPAREGTVWGDYLKPALKWGGRQLLGAGEAALATGVGLVSWPAPIAAKTIGYAAERMRGVDPEEARRYSEELAGEVAGLVNYTPYTEEGRAAAGLALTPIDWLMKAGGYPGRKVVEYGEKVGSPLLQDVGTALEEGGAFIGPVAGLGGAGRLYRGLKGRGAPPIQDPRAAVLESEASRRSYDIQQRERAIVEERVRVPGKPLSHLAREERQLREERWQEWWDRNAEVEADLRRRALNRIVWPDFLEDVGKRDELSLGEMDALIARQKERLDARDGLELSRDWRRYRDLLDEVRGKGDTITFDVEQLKQDWATEKVGGMPGVRERGVVGEPGLPPANQLVERPAGVVTGERILSTEAIPGRRPGRPKGKARVMAEIRDPLERWDERHPEEAPAEMPVDDRFTYPTERVEGPWDMAARDLDTGRVYTPADLTPEDIAMGKTHGTLASALGMNLDRTERGWANARNQYVPSDLMEGWDRADRDARIAREREAEAIPPEMIAEESGITYNGVQKGIPGRIPDSYLFTDSKTHSTFAVTDLADVKRELDRVRRTWGDVARDIKDAFDPGEEGAIHLFGKERDPRRVAAQERLKEDMRRFREKAREAGVPVAAFLRGQGMGEDTVKEMLKADFEVERKILKSVLPEDHARKQKTLDGLSARMRDAWNRGDAEEYARLEAEFEPLQREYDVLNTEPPIYGGITGISKLGSNYREVLLKRKADPTIEPLKREMSEIAGVTEDMDRYPAIQAILADMKKEGVDLEDKWNKWRGYSAIYAQDANIAATRVEEVINRAESRLRESGFTVGRAFVEEAKLYWGQRPTNLETWARNNAGHLPEARNIVEALDRYVEDRTKYLDLGDSAPVNPDTAIRNMNRHIKEGSGYAGWATPEMREAHRRALERVTGKSAEEIRDLNWRFQDLRKVVSDAEYQSPHWQGEKNIVGSMLATDNVGMGGRRHLVVREAQSDINKYQRRARAALEQDAASPDPDVRRGGVANQQSLIDSLDSTMPYSNPNELIMSEALKLALEEGYDRLSWSKGEEITKRYKRMGDADMDFSPKLYDEILPNAVRSLVKKYGIPVEETQVWETKPGVGKPQEVWSVDLNRLRAAMERGKSSSSPLLNERGSTPIFMDLADRILREGDKLAANARRLGKTLEEYLRDRGIGEDLIQRVSAAMVQSKEQEGAAPGPAGPMIPQRPGYQPPPPSQAFGPAVKQRVAKTPHGLRKSPPIYRGEVEMLTGMQDLPHRPLEGAMENPIRTFDRLPALKELLYYPARAAEHLFMAEFKDLREEALALRKSLPRASRERIGAFAVANQEQGRPLLSRMGVEVPTLTEAEMDAYGWFREQLDSLYKRLNEARKKSGKDPFPPRQDYFTFFRDLNAWDEMGINPILAPSAVLEGASIHLKTTPFGFARKRSGELHNVKLDAFDVFERYSRSALRHINVSPVVARGREYLLKLPDLKGGTWQMREEAPNASRFLTRWLDYVAGQKPPTTLPRPVERGLEALNRNLAFAVLGGAVRSALIQPTAIVNTVAEIGNRYTMRGILGLLDRDGAVESAMEKSQVLLGRDFDSTLMEAIKGVGGVKKGVAKATLWPLRALDMETARATWIGAYKKGVAEGNPDPVRYADDVVVRTQANASRMDLAPVQRSTLGRTLTMFQTFVINNWGFLTKDVLGLGNPSITNRHAMGKAMRWVVGATLFNSLFEDVLDMPSPFPAPYHAFHRAKEEGKDTWETAQEVGLEIAQLAPMLGGTRYGSSPVGATADFMKDVAEAVSTKPGPKKLPTELVGKALGIPGTSQVHRTYRNVTKYGMPWWRSVLGSRPPVRSKQPQPLR